MAEWVASCSLLDSVLVEVDCGHFLAVDMVSSRKDKNKRLIQITIIL